MYFKEIWWDGVGWIHLTSSSENGSEVWVGYLLS
jgi:hypothetical protein